MKAEEYIKQTLAIEVDDENLFDESDLTWDSVITLMNGFRKMDRYYSPDEIREIQDAAYDAGVNSVGP